MVQDLFAELQPVVVAVGLELVDVELKAGVLQVTVDREGGVDLEALTDANRAVSTVLDELDPIPGRYSLEVSSPGVERRLRTSVHFQRAVGEQVSVRTVAGGKGERRVTGRLTSADTEGFVLEGDELPGGERRLAYDEVERARTVFAWGSKSPAAARQGGAPRQAARAPRAAARKPAGRKKVATP